MNKSDVFHLSIKVLLFLLALAAMIFYIGKYLGYWKEDVWKQISFGASEVQPTEEELEGLF